jgi:hypothetical protein
MGEAWRRSCTAEVPFLLAPLPLAQLLEALRTMDGTGRSSLPQADRGRETADTAADTFRTIVTGQAAMEGFPHRELRHLPPLHVVGEVVEVPKGIQPAGMVSEALAQEVLRDRARALMEDIQGIRRNNQQKTQQQPGECDPLEAAAAAAAAVIIMRTSPCGGLVGGRRKKKKRPAAEEAVISSRQAARHERRGSLGTKKLAGDTRHFPLLALCSYLTMRCRSISNSFPFAAYNFCLHVPASTIL